MLFQKVLSYVCVYDFRKTADIIAPVLTHIKMDDMMFPFTEIQLKYVLMIIFIKCVCCPLTDPILNVFETNQTFSMTNQ